MINLTLTLTIKDKKMGINMHILVTGGAGYIGSHTCLELLNHNHSVTVVDNLSNSNYESLKRVQKLTGKKLVFHEVDLLNRAELDSVLKQQKFDAVIHFAALKAVGESVEIPLRYYNNNVVGTLNLLEAMGEVGLKNFVFSSSATVYGDPHTVPITEEFPLKATNPYGRTKLMMEDILRDVGAAHGDMNIVILRYFNPIGAHESGQIGEDPKGIPNNLFPYISQVAVGRLKELAVFGGDYPTRDGTGIRDFIHVVDLAIGHVKAIELLASTPGVVAYNLGTGTGYSVLEAIQAFSKASGRKIPFRIIDRRPGDVAECYADPTKANNALKWKAVRGLAEMCTDAWCWQNKNPQGYPF